MQNLITFQNALKDNYLPAWNNLLGIEPTALLGQIKKVPLTSNNIVATAPTGLSGGFGFGEEGAATPASGNVQFLRFKTNAKDMYVNVCISAKAVRLTGNGGAMANALDTEMKGAYATAKWNVGRALFGNGSGKLAGVKSISGTTVTVDSVKNLKEGLIIDIYDNTSTPATLSNGTGRRIVSINRSAKTITLSTGSSIGALTASADSNGVKGFITVQNSYGREITGLGAIFDDNIATIYDVTKANYPFLSPVVKDANSDLTDTIITQALREAKNDKNSEVDMLLCGDSAYDAYAEYLRVSNKRIEEISTGLKGGFKAIKFLFGNREVNIVNESFVPESEIWGVDTKALELHTQEWNFADLQGGGIFNLMENQSVYRALLVNYGDLICTNPGGCIRIINCA